MNKHDELLRKIEASPDKGNVVVSRAGERLGVIGTIDELKSLADEYEKLREMLTKAEHVGFKRFYIDRPCWNGDKESWYIFDSEKDDLVSNTKYDTALDAYAALKAQQSGEEGE